MKRSTRHRGGGPRWSRLLVVAAVLVGLVSATPRVQAESMASGFSMSDYWAIAADPDSGRVFVSGDDHVRVFAPDGSDLGTVDDLPGARGMAFQDGYLWVALTSADSIAKVDPVALAKVGVFATGVPVNQSIAATGGRIWFGSESMGTRPYQQHLLDLDPVNGSVTGHGDVGRGLLRAVPGDPTVLLIGGQGGSPYNVVRYPLSEGQIEGTYGVPHGLGGNLRNFVATEAGTFVVAAGGPYRFDELAVEPSIYGMMPTGVVYPATNYPNGIAYTPALGGLFAGTTASTNQLFVSRRGVPVTSYRAALPGSSVTNGVALAPDGSRAYALTEVGDQLQLNTFVLEPTATGLSASSAVAGRTTRAIVSGSGLGGVTGVRLGGEPVDFASDGADRLVLDIRTSQPPGPATLQLNSPWGATSLPFTVLARPDSALRGRVSDNGAPVPGASVVLTDIQGDPSSTTTDELGGWELSGVVAGDGYDIVVVAGSRSHRWGDEDLAGPGPWEYHVDLASPPVTDSHVRRLVLPPGEVRRVVTDPASGRTFVAVGDTIVVTDPQGRQVGRVSEQWTVSDLQVVGDELYAMLQRAGAISVIDIASLEVVNRFPVQRHTTGALAIAGGKAHYTNGDQQWTKLATLDLAAGTIIHEPSQSLYTPFVTELEGLPDEFVSWEGGAQTANIDRWSATGSEIQLIASSAHGVMATPVADLLASSTEGRIWTNAGFEVDLATLTPTGFTYPAGPLSRALAHSPGLGGTFVFGRHVVLDGSSVRSHELPAVPADRSVSIDSTGTRAYVGTEDGELVTSDLAPVVTSISPNPLVVSPTGVAVSGWGLGAASAVRIDGQVVPFSAVGPGSLNVSVPSLGPGPHRLTVQTPWGASSPHLLGMGRTSGPDRPFESWEELVVRLFQDLEDRTPTVSELSTWVTDLSSGAKTKGELVAARRLSSDHLNAVDPGARLYRAFLGRTPDRSGFDFWTRRRRSGSWTLVRMADHFASSSEFLREYGNLSNRAFVTRIYTDVLDRPADQGGVDYWTRQLDLRRRNRGSVMVGFSESSEYKRLQAENTDVAVVYLFTLGRAPSDSEVDDWTSRQKSGASVALLAGEILASQEYADRVIG